MLDAQAFLPTVHGQQTCTDCHRGEQSADKDTAHSGLVADPSEDSQETCGECHPDVVDVYPNSLHATQKGYWTMLDQRSTPENHPALEEMFGNHCARCHTTCGECHVSQPTSVGGGLYSGHVYEKTPPMTRSCTACHGSRVGNEYLGKNEGLPGDVHFREGRMNCVDCHKSHELHGQPSDCSTCHTSPELAQVPPADHRFASVQMPSCESCHAAVITGQDGIEMHTEHGADLSCQVCHSITYTSCDNCHVALSEKTSAPFFETDATYFTFLIGRNTRKSYTRPYDFVPVRHVPAAPDAFSYYGEDLQPNFNAAPTWMYATPHNIQTKTPQTESCNACHGNPDLFLTADKVAPAELEANQDVILTEIPAEVEEPEETSSP
jgi:thiosulfate/3-mercaptopyruvate sulfurtransferase